MGALAFKILEANKDSSIVSQIAEINLPQNGVDIGSILAVKILPMSVTSCFIVLLCQKSLIFVRLNYKNLTRGDGKALEASLQRDSGAKGWFEFKFPEG